MFPTAAGPTSPTLSLSALSLDMPARASGRGKARMADEFQEGEEKSSPMGLRDPQAALMKVSFREPNEDGHRK